ncbi:GNAT family N-acetyltransferase [Acidovorax sp. SRB_14]|uniref:bifunctional acetate--CoA ligase family protein/GNAT family N-acetyltransferase n=1 Tax=Acidovorax sp. SRB_14 TaxID=1962699 RepID=UPI00156709F6|nr:bifunctional acetate--CoA ligase family protein/GNAT family N-acetyltransferase [Acidovorax sp. SRB_14]NMM79524.1 GNAT family N-acetyltransferase [Acidovorax sp. SRB_14]
MDKHYLTPLFTPASIAVLAGSSEAPEQLTPQARAVHSALRAQKFKGTLQFLDVHTSGTLADLAQRRADLTVIALPAQDLPAALEVAARIGSRAALVISSGVGAAEAAELKKIAQREGIYLLGPNSMGLQRPVLGLNASAVGPLANAGPLALVSQSGALTSAILDWAGNNGVGFSSVVSLGPETALDIAQVLDFLASDPHTQSIVVYLEGISNAREFMSALRSAAHAKPVVVLKAGRKPAGNRAALTHSAAIVGSDDVFDAALRRAGAVRVRSFVELFSAAKCLASRYRAVGPRLAIVTNGGGPGVLAADWVNEIGLDLGTLQGPRAQALAPQLPPLASLSDLINLSEDATPAHYQLAVEAASAEPLVDGVLAIYSPRSNADASGVARALAQTARQMSKPLLTCFMGDAQVVPARAVLREAALPAFRTPEAAVGAFGDIASFYQNQKMLQQTPTSLSALAKPDIAGARLLIESVLAEQRHVLTEIESKTLLAAFHIPVTQTVLARSANEAMMIATQLGFPVALKIDSPDVAHKSDVGGVALDIRNGSAARDAYNDMVQRVAHAQPGARINGVSVQRMARGQRGREICIGMVSDEPFGPVITFGAGGTMIELINDRAMELPPLNQYLAHHLIERSRVAQTLGEWRNAQAVNREVLEQTLLRVSEMVCALPSLREMDINPLIVDEFGAVAVDARIVIGHAQHSSGFGHLAIPPYPAQYEHVWPLRDGGQYTVRPIRPDDAPQLQALVQGLSPQSRYFRFVSSLVELPPSMLARFALIDYDREMALAAIFRERQVAADGTVTETERLVGVSRYVTNPDHSSCEFGLVVADDFNGKGLGSRLMLSIMDVARDRGLAEIEGLVLANNTSMLRLMRNLGFAIKPFAEDADFKLVTHRL